jgi:hypothetical protein
MIPRTVLVASLACATACSQGRAHEERSSYAYTHVDGVDVKIETAGVCIQVDAALPFEQRSSSSSSGPATETKSIAGLPFGVRAGAFFLGPSEYGPVHAGSSVRVGADGVEVDGEARGPLPAEAAAAIRPAPERP